MSVTFSSGVARGMRIERCAAAMATGPPSAEAADAADGVTVMNGWTRA